MNDLQKNLTTVSTIQTSIKYFNEAENKVGDVVVIGKLNQTESKKYLEDCELGLFISKETVKETFEVETAQLLSIRI